MCVSYEKRINNHNTVKFGTESFKIKYHNQSDKLDGAEDTGATLGTRCNQVVPRMLFQNAFLIQNRFNSK